MRPCLVFLVVLMAAFPGSFCELCKDDASGFVQMPLRDDVKAYPEANPENGEKDRQNRTREKFQRVYRKRSELLEEQEEALAPLSLARGQAVDTAMPHEDDEDCDDDETLSPNPAPTPPPINGDYCCFKARDEKDYCGTCKRLGPYWPTICSSSLWHCKWCGRRFRTYSMFCSVTPTEDHQNGCHCGCNKAGRRRANCHQGNGKGNGNGKGKRGHRAAALFRTGRAAEIPNEDGGDKAEGGMGGRRRRNDDDTQFCSGYCDSYCGVQRRRRRGTEPKGLVLAETEAEPTEADAALAALATEANAAFALAESETV